MSIERLETLSERVWCRRCLISKKKGKRVVSIDKIMKDETTMFQVFIGNNCHMEFDNLKEAFTEYELRT